MQKARLRPYQPSSRSRSCTTFEVPRKYRREGRLATMNIRPVDSVGSPMVDLYVCALHIEALTARAGVKGYRGLDLAAARDRGRRWRISAGLPLR